MMTSPWKQLLAGAPWFRGENSYPIAAYSEFMPAPRLGPKAYPEEHEPPVDCDEAGWNISEYEEAIELRPGLEQVARTLVAALVHLGRGEPAHGIARNKLEDNPYWPSELAEHAGKLAHEHYLMILPLALSRTQDDKGRVRWTLFGGSEQGPARTFWNGFFQAPGQERPAEESISFFRRLVHDVYGDACGDDTALHRAGFRILNGQTGGDFSYWDDHPLPSWAEPFLLADEQVHGVKYLLTFRPFARLSEPIRRAYLDGKLHLLPFPGSLLFWGTRSYVKLQQELPLALQLPLLSAVPRHEGPFGIRVPQSGWLHEPRRGEPGPNEHHGPIRNTFHRTHRWSRVHRDEDELAVEARPAKLLHVLFSTAPEDVGLYGKPMARNVQLWTHEYQLLLDGPNALPEQVHRAKHEVVDGGLFGYRFQYPAMRIGRHEVYWHRPLVAYLCKRTHEPVAVHDAPLGFLTAYHPAEPEPDRAVMLWPRLLRREEHVAAIQLFRHVHDPRPHLTSRNVRKIFHAHELFGNKPIPQSLARQLVNLPRHQDLEDWLDCLPERASHRAQGQWLADQLRAQLTAQEPKQSSRPLTYGKTATRTFETAYWKTIAYLASGKYRNKDNADCVRTKATQALLKHHHRDLEAFGDYLLAYYVRRIRAARMSGRALAGELPFRWETDFDFDWMGGWLENQKGKTYERDLLVVIPGRDRSRAVIMADHYDTAYMENVYDRRRGARLAAAGADDNHSATVALMLGANVFLGLSKAGKLDCDVWLVHLTGEEFPADCLGARFLAQQLVQRTLRLRLKNGEQHDLSHVRVQGVYVLDMVAHNNDRARDIFQIAPGSGAESLWLAEQAHHANEAWNEGTKTWNARAERKNAGRGQRSPSGQRIPRIALHPELSGEIRLPFDPRSTLYNTDGQIFSDAGIPVVLFMENYDINREGYHDTHDTMENIDLDYGAAVAAIAIESVARAAAGRPGNPAGKAT
jgi:hypothetical protein